MAKKKKDGAVHRAKKTAKVATVSLALGAVIGAAYGLMKAPKKGKELQDDVTREAQKLWKQLKITKKQAEQMVEKTLGEVSPETLELFAKAKSDILARVAKSKEKMNKKEFEKIVDSAMKRVSRSKAMQPKLKKLGKELKKMWKDISKNL